MVNSSFVVYSIASNKVEEPERGSNKEAMARVGNKNLKKLKRSELLEIMLAQGEEIDRLRAELARKDAELRDRRITLEESGSLAEASLRLTAVFEEAQKAADLYLENVKRVNGPAAAHSPAAPASAPAAAAPAQEARS